MQLPFSWACQEETGKIYVLNTFEIFLKTFEFDSAKK
jgi:hypothetical protein